MVLNLIQLWRFKAEAAGGLPFEASEDLSHMTFDIMEAAAFNIPPSESSTVKHFSKLRDAELPRSTWSKVAEFPTHETVPDLLQAVHSIESAASVVLGLPFGRWYHFYNNNFNPEMRRTTKLKERRCKYPPPYSSTLLAQSLLPHTAGEVVPTTLSSVISSTLLSDAIFQ